MSENSERCGRWTVNPAQLVLLTGVTIMLFSGALASPLVSSAAADSGVHVTLNPTRDTVEPGETVQIGVTVENDADSVSPAPVLSVDTLPNGWAIESWSGTEATYRNSTDEWLWTTIESGETIKFTITISLPADISGTGTIGVALADGDNRTAAADTTLTVEDAPTGEEANTSEGGEDRPVVYEIPGFGFNITLLAIFVLSGILARIQSK